MKFTTRELLLVTLIVSISLGWYLDHRRTDWENTKLHHLANAIKSLVEQKGFIVTVSADGTAVGIRQK